MMCNDILYPLRRVHGWIHEYIQKKREQIALRKYYRTLFQKKQEENGKCVFLVLTPEHTNLGDHAIAYSEVKLLNELGIGYIEITGKELVSLQRKQMLSVMNGYPIMINGGGNLGTLWFDVEELMREIVVCNPKSSIAIMPNTIFYEDSAWGKKEFERSKKIYNAHKKLAVYARERISFEKMNGNYRCVKLMPDMVMFLNESRNTTQRKGCLICLRTDCEKTITEEEQDTLLREVQLLFGDDVTLTDTHAIKSVPIDERKEALQQKFAEFRHAQLVITDRLHGMVFCAITATPCIVINSRSPKVKGCYEWIKDCKYIQFCDDISNIRNLYASIPKDSMSYNHHQFDDDYRQLSEDILNLC